MKIEVFSDADSVARKAAALIASEARSAVARRGSFIMAVSGGHTPWIMLRALAGEQVPWNSVHVVQADERIAAAGDPDRNLTHLRESLLEHAPLTPEQLHAMPVELPDLKAACTQYGQTLRAVAGSPPVLDLVHLGLGPDGHTASLVPGDPVLEITDADVALAGPLPRTAAHDFDVPDLESLPLRAVACNWGRKSGNACPPASGGHRDS